MVIGDTSLFSWIWLNIDLIYWTFLEFLIENLTENIFSFPPFLLDNVNCEKPRLEISPSQSPQRLPVGNSKMITCQGKVDNPDLISDLRWKGQDNMTIQPKQ